MDLKAIFKTAGQEKDWDRAVKRFQKDPKSSIQRIRKKIIIDLCAVISHLIPDRQSLREDLHAPLFETILHNLSDFEWYDAPGSKEFRERRHSYAWTHLVGLACFSDPNDDIAKLISDSWRTIVKWLFILTKETNKDILTLPFGQMNRSLCISRILYSLTSHPSTKSILCREVVFTFALKFWMRQDHDFKSECYAALSLSICISGMVAFGGAVKIADFAYDQLLDMTHLRLRMASIHCEEEPYLVGLALELWSVMMDADFGSGRSEPRHFDNDPDNTFLYIIRQNLKSWKEGTGSNFSEQKTLVNSCFDAWLKYLKCLESKDYLTRLKDVLLDDLLYLCLSLGAYAPLDSEGNVGNDFPIIFLRHHLPRLLTYNSWVWATTDAVDEISDSTLKSLSMGHPAYREAWSDLQELLSYRLASSLFFDISKPQYRCSNMECTATGSKYQFYRCSGCYVMLYCSEECEKVAWKTQGHRSTCSKLEEESAGTRLDISVKDYSHLILLARCEVSRHIAALQSTAARDFPNVNIKDLCFVVDFMTYPPSIFLERPQDSEWTENCIFTEVLFTMAVNSPTLSSEEVAVLRITPFRDLRPERRYSTMHLVYMDKSVGRLNRGPRLTTVLDTGMIEGGKTRESCHVGHWRTVNERTSVETEYDVIDELIRRVGIYEFDAGTEKISSFAERVEEEVEKLCDESDEIGPIPEELIIL